MVIAEIYSVQYEEKSFCMSDKNESGFISVLKQEVNTLTQEKTQLLFPYFVLPSNESFGIRLSIWEVEYKIFMFGIQIF